MPAPTAAELPLEEPPGVLVVSNGLRVGPGLTKANSVVTVFPTMSAPARRNASTDAESNPVSLLSKIGLPNLVGMSRVWITSFIPIGIPSTGESGVPEA